MRNLTRRAAVVAGSLALVLSSAVGLGAVGASAQPSPSASSAQCRNGPPTDLQPCDNPLTTGAFGYVTGNANASQAHWAEGDFIPYRVYLSGLRGGAGSAGNNTLVFRYPTVYNAGAGKFVHALDYMGSFDATETTGPPTRLHRNENNPCVDLLGTTAGSGCTRSGTPPIPVSTRAVPLADLATQKTCAGASGLSTTPTQVRGDFSLFAPDAAGASITDASYVSQNVVASTGCYTTMSVTVHVTNGPANVVLAFGGRIASALDWGEGNSATAISGSPYSLQMVSLNGASTGTQSRNLATGAVAPHPTPITTQVSDTTIPVGGTLTDTATLTGVPVSGVAGGPPTGTVQFQLCSGTTTGCEQGKGVDIGSPVDLAQVGTTNNSSATSESFGSNLGPGNYCVGAVYTNDEDSFYSSAYHDTPDGECFTVLPPVVPTVSAGYTDGYRMIANDHPSPWEGSQDVKFVGCNHVIPGTACSTGAHGPIYDAGAIMIHNTTGQEITVTDASVTAGGCDFTHQWQGLTEHVPDGHMLILTQTGGPAQCPGTGGRQAQNFDTSEVNHLAGTAKCTEHDGVIPELHVTVDGVVLTYRDTQQILNTGGVDPGAPLCGSRNETHDWAPMEPPSTR